MGNLGETRKYPVPFPEESLYRGIRQIVVEEKTTRVEYLGETNESRTRERDKAQNALP